MKTNYATCTMYETQQPNIEQKKPERNIWYKILFM